MADNKNLKQKRYKKALEELTKAGIDINILANSGKSIEQAYEETFNKPIKSISTPDLKNVKVSKSDSNTISNLSTGFKPNKSGVKETYMRHYGIDPNLGTVPKFVPQYLGDIPTNDPLKPKTGNLAATDISQYIDKPGNISIPQSQATTPTSITNTDSGNSNNVNYGDYTSLLKFAPAVGSLVNLLDKDKAAEVNLQRTPQQRALIPQSVNEMTTQSLIDSSYNKTVGDIINTSGGSAGASRAGVLAAGLGASKARAKAFSDINLANISNKLTADQFNITGEARVGAANTGIANQERLINLQNQLAAEAKKEADRNAFFSSLGQIGVEQFQGNVIQGANSGYGTDIFGKPTYKR